ncbi:MAG TPA: DUF2934 domain-containing protein [Candidatus Acidoferrales bacterium]|nr:DUF2934 domain-containing protein [Candidatus Acidoferrales bacterium]
MSNLQSKEEIEKRAYEIYMERGSQGGRELQDWLAAEREVSQKQSASGQKRADTEAANSPRSVSESRNRSQHQHST